jgi:hypothetical protein
MLLQHSVPFVSFRDIVLRICPANISFCNQDGCPSVPLDLSGDPASVDAVCLSGLAGHPVLSVIQDGPSGRAVIACE